MNGLDAAALAGGCGSRAVEWRAVESRARQEVDGGSAVDGGSEVDAADAGVARWAARSAGAAAAAAVAVIGDVGAEG